MEKMEGKMKMVSLFFALLAGLALTTFVSCSEDDEWVLPNVERTETAANADATTQNSVSSSSVLQSSFSERKSEPTNKWSARRGKPFFYGKKFELQNESNVNRYDLEENRKQGGMISPLITSPIRTLPYTPDSNKHKRNNKQKDILTDVRESLSENSDGIFNKTYFMEAASEAENNGGEVTTTKTISLLRNSEAEEESSPTSRRNFDRSLMVVLPFKPNDNDSVEELFTKKPLVKMVETSSNFQRMAEKYKGKTTPVMREKEIVTTTEFDRKSFLTRRPWRPAKRTKVTTEAYPTTTESGEDATRTYTNYNDVEQVTKKFQNFESDKSAEQVSNHNYDTVDVVLPYPVKRLRNKTPAPAVVPEEDGIGTPKNLDDDVEIRYKQRQPAVVKFKRKNQTKKTSDQLPKQEDITKVLEILPANMKDVIVKLGLNKDNQVQSDEKPEKEVLDLKKTSQPTIDPKSFSVFKPIPLETRDEGKEAVSEDMKTFLASFGLFPAGKRDQKSLRTPETIKRTEGVSEGNLGFLPDDLKLVLDDLGLVKYAGTREQEQPSAIHIFNPSNHSVGKSDEDLKKLNAILSSIKTTVSESQSFAPEKQSEVIHKINELNSLRYKTGNVTDIDNEIKKIVSDGEKPNKTTKRATKLTDGPDPLIFTEENISKNDVKRQDVSVSSSSSSSSTSGDGRSSSASSSASSSSSVTNDDSASSSTSSSSSSFSDNISPTAEESSTTTTTTTTTEENPNLEALKDSFGGGETASDSEDVDSALPPKRPNGLYLLLDWNSFLEVGTEDDNRRVNLRFQPKVGDSRNFLPIRVP